MKAAVYTQYGPPEVLHLAEVEKPVPKENEVLVKVRATTVNYGDLLARNFGNTPPGDFNMPFLFYIPARMDFGFSKPRKNILGSEFAGDVEAVGEEVKRFKVGDAVFGYPGQKMGAYAEYLCMPEDGSLALKPASMSYEEAAVIPYGAITALNLLRKMNLRRGQKVLIVGASGGIGAAAVQLATHFGAEVTGVCGAPRMDFVRSLGAVRAIDYRQEDFTQSGEKYDLVFDVLGKSSFAECKPILKADGRYLRASFKMRELLQMGWTSLAGGPKVICALSGESPEDLEFIKELIKTGEFKALLDRCFPLEEAAEAHRYVESGQKKGQIAITMPDPASSNGSG